MFLMKRIYTRTGDKGTTGIHGGERVAKDDIRIEANGTLDELNCQIGVVRSLLHPQDARQQTLHQVQCNLMVIMSLVATPSQKRAQNPNLLPDDIVSDCEELMDTICGRIGAGAYFLLPGGTPVSSQLQLARAVCRRAERLLWTLNRRDPVPEEILQYINRLSDLMFVLAREEMNMQDWPEERWQQFSYKNKQ